MTACEVSFWQPLLAVEVISYDSEEKDQDMGYLLGKGGGWTGNMAPIM